jgi:hypothetical protein
VICTSSEGRRHGLHQHLLQVGQLDVEHLALHYGRAQRGVGLLAARDLQRKRRGAKPQHQLGKVVQQRGFVQHRRVVVHAVVGKGEGRSAPRAASGAAHGKSRQWRRAGRPAAPPPIPAARRC